MHESAPFAGTRCHQKCHQNSSLLRYAQNAAIFRPLTVRWFCGLGQVFLLPSGGRLALRSSRTWRRERPCAQSVIWCHPYRMQRNHRGAA
jgi:hypothetical protein